MFSQQKNYFPFVSPFDPCVPIRIKIYETPPSLYLDFQPNNLPQFSLRKAASLGTLWTVLYSPYPSKKL
ncbi:CotJA protein [Bacillus methanolicus PB1]|uniref:CotJA protein n=1 Tax=Bacillus methanolicus PB1 TaxID=997296 RepID=I3E757_BACMT|nr:spore coat associated protein CotJA [Bacillus methanolicus]EIJ82328.1 CotJA protein [Bacillus methanolicus PB1]